MIEAQQLTKRYGEKTAVDRLDFTVRPGTVTVAEHRGSLLPVPQLVPSVVDVTVLARILLPVSGLFTVTE